MGDLVALLLLDGWGGDGGKGCEVVGGGGVDEMRNLFGCALVVGREVRLVSYVQGGY